MLSLGFISPHSFHEACSHRRPSSARTPTVPSPGGRISKDPTLDPLSDSLASQVPSDQEGLETQFPAQSKASVLGGGMWATENSGRDTRAQTHRYTRALDRLGKAAVQESSDSSQRKPLNQTNHSVCLRSAEAT